MVIVVFPSGADWSRAGRIYRRFAEDVIELSGGDEKMRFLLERGDDFGTLYLNRMDREIVEAVLGVMKDAAKQTLAGKTLGWKRDHPDDEEGHDIYLKSISALLDMINREKLE